MCYILYVAFMLFLLGFGAIAVWHGVGARHALPLLSGAEAYDPESFMLNIWGSIATLVIGIILSGIGIYWILSQL